jgi:hypothetical protein
MVAHSAIDHTGITGTGAAAFKGVRVSRASGTVSLGNNVVTAIGFDEEEFDTDTFHDNSTNNTRLTIPTTGKYHIGGNFYTTTSLVADGLIRVDGTQGIAFVRNAATGTFTGVFISTIYQLTAGQYVEMCGRTPGGAGTVAFDDEASPVFWAYYLGA